MGHHVPDRVVTNDDLAQIIDTSSEWIIQRTGIEERRWVDGDVGAADLAFEATKGALDEAGIEAKDLDMIIFATLSPKGPFVPATVACTWEQRSRRTMQPSCKRSSR